MIYIYVCVCDIIHIYIYDIYICVFVCMCVYHKLCVCLYVSHFILPIWRSEALVLQDEMHFVGGAASVRAKHDDVAW